MPITSYYHSTSIMKNNEHVSELNSAQGSHLTDSTLPEIS